MLNPGGHVWLMRGTAEGELSVIAYQAGISLVCRCHSWRRLVAGSHAAVTECIWCPPHSPRANNAVIGRPQGYGHFPLSLKPLLAVQLRCLQFLTTSCTEDDQAMGYVEQLSQRLAPPYEADGSRELRRKVSMEGTAHVGHRQLPRVVLEESPFELRALEVCLDLVRPCGRHTAWCCGAVASESVMEVRRET